ncbi:nicotinate-nucleotide adenylyltransferase [Flavobacteriaceae bacterium JJC]|uniref:nicotinate-nucleotide adenylyltransferase n=1 Tax=Kaistella soli TaxID=2849654 RepID=UPI000B4B4BF7|nr:nicotinate-nucleotide adenylyltransferase [Kaistella soli]MBU8881924.1 TonB-dependent receptor [Kaistella soli]OWK73958.1 nicotinate-nucleotide adenylyltransferase [Flavobacteriaceae bacterium JJC]
MPVLNQQLTPKQKALAINLDANIYGTFAEIGAGQETVRHFFRAGGASRTIAKAMSAYDKDFSDAIYGKEAKNRYVTQNRLRKMLRYEVSLIEERLTRENNPGRKFFSYANTVTTINFNKTMKGHGWVGLRFQLDEKEDYNEIVFHVKFMENDATLQQETLGSLGVNLIYGAYNFSDNPRKLIESLYDDISTDNVEIDMIDFSGPAFTYVDNRLMSLQLVKNGMTDAVIFNPEGNNMLPADILYKKNIFAVRGSFRPVTLVNIDMFERGLEMFMKDSNCSFEETVVLFEITISNLRAAGDIDERDFLDRVDVLAKLGYTVIISNFSEYYRLIDYFANYTNGKIGVAMGVNNLLDVFDEDYYKNLSGGILEAFGKFFKQDMRVYLYPYKDPETHELLTSNNLKVHDNLKELYKYFKLNQRIVDIKDYNPDYSEIYSREILNKIANHETGWEKQVPDGVAEMIKERGMFGYKEELKLKEFS